MTGLYPQLHPENLAYISNFTEARRYANYSNIKTLVNSYKIVYYAKAKFYAKLYNDQGLLILP